MDPMEWDWTRLIFDHVHLRVSDLEKSKAFYATVLEPLGIRCSSVSAGPPYVPGPGVVRGEREQHAVQRLDLAGAEVAAPEKAEVLHARVHVLLGVLDVGDADVRIRRSGAQHLHDPDGPRAAALALVEPASAAEAARCS